MTERYAEQREVAADRLEGTVSFAVLSKSPAGSTNFTFGVDEEEYPSSTEATTQQVVLLGHHIRHLAALLEVDESRVIELAMEASVGFEAD
jgi:hypothetical protein